MAETKKMFVSLTMESSTAFTVVDMLTGRQGSGRIDVPGLIGFLPVFDNQKDAAEWGNGRVAQIHSVNKAAEPEGSG